MKRRTHRSFVLPASRRAVLLPVLLCGLCLFVFGCADGDSETASREGLRSINGTELFVKRIGNGDPIVVVHGGPMADHGYLQQGHRGSGCRYSKCLSNSKKNQEPILTTRLRAHGGVAAGLKMLEYCRVFPAFESPCDLLSPEIQHIDPKSRPKAGP